MPAKKISRLPRAPFASPDARVEIEWQGSPYHVNVDDILSGALSSTDRLPEGLSNLYYSDQRVSRNPDVVAAVEGKLPAGGNTGQILAKKSAESFETEWQTITTEANRGENLPGAGEPVYAGMSSQNPENLSFKTVNAASPKVQVASTSDQIDIDLGTVVLEDLADADVANPDIGDLMVWDGSKWSKIQAGTAGYALVSNGPGATPTWQQITASGGAPVAAPETALYWVAQADATLTNEIVVNDLASLNAAISGNLINDAPNDANQYARQGGNWTVVSGSSSGDATSIRGVDIDSSVGSPADGQIMVYRSAGSDWVLETKPTGGSGTTDLSIAARGSDTFEVASSSGTNATVPAATINLSGGMTAADKSKLDNIEAQANNYTHPNHTGDCTSTGDGATTVTALRGVPLDAGVASPTDGDILVFRDGFMGFGLEAKPTAGAPTLTDHTAVVYVSKIGNDSNSGLDIEETKLTIGSAITAASALLVGGATGVQVHVMDGGRYTEDITVPAAVHVHAPSAELVGTVTLDGDQCSAVFDAVYANTGTNVVTKTTAGHGYFYANLIDGRGTGGALTGKTNVLCQNTGVVLHAHWHLMYVGQSGTGITDNAGGDGHIHFRGGDIYLAGSFAEAIDVGSASSIIGWVDHILETGSPSSTVALQINNNGAEVRISAKQIIADTAWNIPGTGELYLECPDVQGTRTGTPTRFVGDQLLGTTIAAVDVSYDPSGSSLTQTNAQDALDEVAGRLDSLPGGGAVDSVNGETGVVVLDADDIDDATTAHKFVTATDLTTIANTPRFYLVEPQSNPEVAVQAAIDAANVAGGGVVVLAPGLYDFQDTVLVKDKVRITGMPGAQLTKQATASAIFTQASGATEWQVDSLEIIGSGRGHDATSFFLFTPTNDENANIVIRDIRILDVNVISGRLFNTINDDLTGASKCYNITLDNVYCRHVSVNATGFLLKNCVNLVVRNCRFQRHRSNEIGVVAGTAAGTYGPYTFENCHFETTLTECVLVENPQSDVILDSITFNNCTFLDAINTANASAIELDAYNMQNVQLHGNYMKTPNHFWGFLSHVTAKGDIEHISVKDNTLDVMETDTQGQTLGARVGIQCNAKQGIIANNIVAGFSGAGINVFGPVIVSNNCVKYCLGGTTDTQQSGIDLGSRCVATGNYVYNCGGAGANGGVQFMSQLGFRNTTRVNVFVSGNMVVDDRPTFDFDAADVAAETITIAGHGLQNNDAVTYLDAGGTALDNLTYNYTYWVISATTDTFQLSATRDGAAIAIANGAGAQRLTARGTRYGMRMPKGAPDQCQAASNAVHAGWDAKTNGLGTPVDADITNDVFRTDFDADTVTTAALADVVATLMRRLAEAGVAVGQMADDDILVNP